MKQVITVSPSGEVSGLHRKAGQGLDLCELGHAEIERASEIVWSGPPQAWYIAFLRGPLAGQQATLAHVLACGGTVTDDGPGEAPLADDEVLFFEDYDEAVRAEVAILDGMRLKGQF